MIGNVAVMVAVGDLAMDLLSHSGPEGGPCILWSLLINASPPYVLWSVIIPISTIQEAAFALKLSRASCSVSKPFACLESASKASVGLCCPLSSHFLWSC